MRKTFTDFFTSRGHQQVPSSPLIPDDPTLLLANAGMNQFKPYFLGETTPPFPRATSIQKCARTSDIDNVGRTNRHATFFEMMGNFSFGDYFKEDAIAFAWELLTQGYGLEKDKLWITVFEDDDEAEHLWRRIGVPASRIQRLGMEDNYWSMGVPGPCGPCSEVNYDRGPAFGKEGGPAIDDERYVEIWNLVFMQFQRGEGDKKGNFPILGKLTNKSIDTGLGLDRLAAILQDAQNVCTTDLLLPTFHTVQDLAGRACPTEGEEKVSFQVVTEHARSIAFLIADGVLPAKDGRGYILRRLMRRAIRHARRLGIDGHVLPATTASVIGNLGTVWPELTNQAALIEQVVTAEEESFTRALVQGTRLLDTAITHTREARSAALPGETAFELADTYGFPLELTVEAAREAGLTVDEERFAALLDEQKKRAKAGGKAKTADALRKMDTYRELAGSLPRTDSRPDLGVIRDVFIPQGRIIANVGDEPVVYDLDAFIEPRQKMLTDGTLTEFREWEVAERTEIFGSIAHRFSEYRKSGFHQGEWFEGSGHKTTQFVRTPSGWRMSSLAWDDAPATVTE
ncbi:alanine--tRNA ligase [Streptomyces nigrescens]